MYLGLDITSRDEGTVYIIMEEYIREAIQAFGEDIITNVNRPEMRTLFEVNGDKNYWGFRSITHIITFWKNLYMCPIDTE